METTPERTFRDSIAGRFLLERLADRVLEVLFKSQRQKNMEGRAQPEVDGGWDDKYTFSKVVICLGPRTRHSVLHVFVG